MESEHLFKQIERQQGTVATPGKRGDGKTVKFIVFLIGGKRYALYADDIREIILDYPLFYVPFVPPYVRGFINRHGEPHTVIDLNVLFEQTKLETTTFMVLNRDDDQLALVITEINEIVKIQEADVHLIMGDTGEEGYFLGAVTSGGGEILIIDLDRILDRLEKDLAAR